MTPEKTIVEWYLPEHPTLAITTLKQGLSRKVRVTVGHSKITRSALSNKGETHEKALERLLPVLLDELRQQGLRF